MDMCFACPGSARGMLVSDHTRSECLLASNWLGTSFMNRYLQNRVAPRPDGRNAAGPAPLQRSQWGPCRGEQPRWHTHMSSSVPLVNLGVVNDAGSLAIWSLGVPRKYLISLCGQWGACRALEGAVGAVHARRSAHGPHAPPARPQPADQCNPAAKQRAATQGRGTAARQLHAALPPCAHACMHSVRAPSTTHHHMNTMRAMVDTTPPAPGRAGCAPAAGAATAPPPAGASGMAACLLVAWADQGRAASSGWVWRAMKDWLARPREKKAFP